MLEVLNLAKNSLLLLLLLFLLLLKIKNLYKQSLRGLKRGEVKDTSKIK